FLAPDLLSLTKPTGSNLMSAANRASRVSSAPLFQSAHAVQDGAGGRGIGRSGPETVDNGFCVAYRGRWPCPSARGLRSRDEQRALSAVVSSRSQSFVCPWWAEVSPDAVWLGVAAAGVVSVPPGAGGSLRLLRPQVVKEKGQCVFVPSGWDWP